MIKESMQIRRDRTTLGLIIGIPLLQLVLFSFAINTDPKHLPTAINDADKSKFSRTIVQAMHNSDYFHFITEVEDERQAKRLLDTGEALFVINIPPNFSRDIVRGQRPNILLEVDGTDPGAPGQALGVFTQLMHNVIDSDLEGALQHLHARPPAFETLVHTLYNPLRITQFNIIPGLLGVILTLTLVISTAQAVTREREIGTMENLLASPARPLEVMLGKMMPYVVIGYIQVILILMIAFWIFSVPIGGNLGILLLACLPFIIANLLVGLTLSTVASNQLQATQATVFFFLPSILLSGFMFPFYGMPVWAQWVGDLLPLTHFLRIVRGIILKSNGFVEIWPSVWPILIFIVVILVIGLKRYRQTLD
ncbi:MAG: ABC transporter permease [Gammaproteobacteria bacterium]